MPSYDSLPGWLQSMITLSWAIAIPTGAAALLCTLIAWADTPVEPERACVTTTHNTIVCGRVEQR